MPCAHVYYIFICTGARHVGEGGAPPDPPGVGPDIHFVGCMHQAVYSELRSWL